MAEDVCSARIGSLREFAQAGMNGRIDIDAVRRVSGVGADWDAMLAACEFQEVEGNPGPELSATLDQFRTNETWVRGIATALVNAPVNNGLSVLPSDEVAASMASGSAPDTGVVEYDPQEIVGMPVTSGFVNDPINAATGNFVHADRDLIFPGFGAVLDVVRAYNSFNVSQRGVFGLGWSSLLDVALDVSQASVGVARLSFTDGAVVPFVTNADGEWLPNVRRRMLLEQTDVGWTLSRHNGARIWFFDTEGVLVGGSEGAAGYTVTRDGDADTGTLTMSESRSGRWVRYQFDDGLVIEVVTSDGRSCTYRYDDAGHCVGVERAIGDVVYEIGDDGFLAAMFDADGVPVFHNTYDEVGRTIGQVSPHGRRTSYEYLDNGGTRVTDDDDGPSNLLFHDDTGNLTAMFGADGTAMRASYDQAGRVVRHVDRAGGVTLYDYHHDDRLDLITRKTDPDGLTEERDYDPQGRLVTQRDRSGAVYQFAYDGDAPNPSVITAPEGVELATVYNDAGLPVTITDGDGVVTGFEFDADGQLLAHVNGAGDRTTFAYDPTGQLLAVTDPTGKAASFELDPAGRVRTATDIAGVVSEFVNTAAGRVLSMTTAGPGSWDAVYGDHGDLVSFTDAAGGTVGFGHDECGHVTTITASDGAVTTQQWDGLGLLAAVTDPAGNTATQTHDKAGRSLSVTHYDGRTITRDIDPMGRTLTLTGPDSAQTHRTYHPNGQLASLTNPAGNTWTYNIDGLGRLTTETDPDGETTTYTYSPASRLLQHTTAAGRVYVYGYDLAGRLNQITDPDGEVTSAMTGPDGQLTSLAVDDQTVDFALDTTGRVSSWTNRESETTALLEWEPSSVTASRGDDSPAVFGYDPRGLLNQVTDPGGVITRFQHDVRGRVIGATTNSRAGEQSRSLTYEPSGAIAQTIDPAGNTTTYRNTSAGRLEQLLFGGPEAAAGSDPAFGRSFRYDEAGRLAALGTLDEAELASFVYSPLGLLTETRTSDTATAVGHDVHGSVATVTNTVGDTTRYQRDADGFLTARLDATGNQTEFVRTAAGRLIGYRDTQAGDVTKPDTGDVSRDRAGRIIVDEHGRTHTYDTAGRLEQTLAPDNVSHRFTYNDLGLLATDTGLDSSGTRRFIYNIAGQLTALTDNTGTTEFTYDTAGRRTTQTSSDGTRIEYSWNDLDQLVRIDRTAPTTAPTTAPENGPAGPSTRRITYSGLNRPELIDAGTPGETIIGWDDAITHKPVQIGSTRYLRDGLNVQLAGPDSEWSDGTYHDPYGHNPDNTTGVTLGYRGELTIDGYVFMGDRVYDPTTRTFLSKDPLPPRPGANGAFGSDYAYAWCDPVNYIDPSGREPVSVEEFDAWKEKQETNRFQRAGQAMLDDPWGTLAMAGVVALGVGLMATGVGGPIGAGILIGAAASATMGVATDSFSPRSVAIGGAFGAVPGGHTVRGAFVAGFGEGITSQVLVDGRGISDISLTEAVIQGSIAGAIPALGPRLRNLLPNGTADDLVPGGIGDDLTSPGLVYRGDARPTSDIYPGGFTARQPDMSQYDHLSGGNGRISTSMDPKIGDDFALGSTRRGPVYVIENPGMGYTVDYSGADRAFRRLDYEQEINFARLEPENIVGSFSAREGAQGGRIWSPNPNYVPIGVDQTELARLTRFRGISPDQSAG